MIKFISAISIAAAAMARKAWMDGFLKASPEAKDRIERIADVKFPADKLLRTFQKVMTDEFNKHVEEVYGKDREDG